MGAFKRSKKMGSVEAIVCSPAARECDVEVRTVSPSNPLVLFRTGLEIAVSGTDVGGQ